MFTIINEKLDPKEAFYRMKRTNIFYDTMKVDSLSTKEQKELESLLISVRKTKNEANIKKIEDLFFEKNINLLFSLLIKNFKLADESIIEDEDFMQELYIFYLNAIKRYNGSKRFSTYLYSCMNAINGIYVQNIDNNEYEEFNEDDFYSDSDIENTVDYDFLQKTIDKVLFTLQPREQGVIRLRFGLNGNEPMTLEQVGKRYNVTRERIREIERVALRKLRHPSRAKQLKDFMLD